VGSWVGEAGAQADGDPLDGAAALLVRRGGRAGLCTNRRGRGGAGGRRGAVRHWQPQPRSTAGRHCRTE